MVAGSAVKYSMVGLLAGGVAAMGGGGGGGGAAFLWQPAATTKRSAEDTVENSLRLCIKLIEVLLKGLDGV